MSGNRRKYPPGLLAEAKAMRDGGMSYHAIGIRLDRRPETIRQMLDPDWRERKLAQQRARYHAQKATGDAVHHYSRRHEGGPSVVRVKHLPDTRDLTGVICGDPLPERSALAQRRATNGSAALVSVYWPGSGDSNWGVSSRP